jgi:hypothetical protein
VGRIALLGARQGVDEIEVAVDGIAGLASIPAALSTVTSTLGSMASDVSSAFSALGDLDARGELEDAFRQSDECDSLVGGSWRATPGRRARARRARRPARATRRSGP